ncbi:MAG: thioredoxin domain-containing protein [Deltaproteobacteria bacterium]
MKGLLTKIFGPGTPKVMPVHVDDSNFVDEVRRSKVPVVLDVWSPGCGPCKMMEPVVVSLATRYQGKIKVAELNAAESGATAARLGVSGTPTVLFFKGHHEVDRVVGFVGERYLTEIVDNELLGATP